MFLSCYWKEIKNLGQKNENSASEEVENYESSEEILKNFSLSIEPIAKFIKGLNKKGSPSQKEFLRI